jgi:hypothetical protein
MRWEKTAVYDIEIMHFVGTTVEFNTEVAGSSPNGQVPH